ncbi:hypothetical protein PkoCFBP13504_16865 [Pseudomonas koreensis]|nr:hypothetical protein PkoCFBP13504_16865 [Pseudomonas koreensis]
MNAYFYQCAHCGNSSPFIAALPQPIRLVISLRQRAVPYKTKPLQKCWGFVVSGVFIFFAAFQLQ